MHQRERQDWISRIDAALASLKREAPTTRDETESKRARDAESEGASRAAHE